MNVYEVRGWAQARCGSGYLLLQDREETTKVRKRKMLAVNEILYLILPVCGIFKTSDA